MAILLEPIFIIDIIITFVSRALYYLKYSFPMGVFMANDADFVAKEHKRHCAIPQ